MFPVMLKLLDIKGPSEALCFSAFEIFCSLYNKPVW